MSDLDRWAAETQSGDREDLGFGVPVATWLEVTSDGEDCAPSACAFREGCFYYAHRERAQEADILVVNHALLLANAASYGAVFDTEGRHLVVDEAHRLEEVMAEAFGARVSYPRVRYAARQATKKCENARDVSDGALMAAEVFFEELGQDGTLGGERAAPRSYRTLLEALRSVRNTLANDPREEVNALQGMIGRLHRDLRSFYSEPDDAYAYAIVAGKKGRDPNRKPYPELRSWLVDTAEAFRDGVPPLFPDGGVVLTSATLATGSGPARSFAYPRRRLGLEDRPRGREVREHAGSEVFDYEERCLIYVEEGAKEPPLGASHDHAGASARRAEELVGLSKGGALVVLSTGRAVAAFRWVFRPPYPVRFQGDSPGRLVRWLKETEGAILVGTRTFWEGIDVPGESLCIVIVDRVPFVPPDDPVAKKLCERAGRAWLKSVTLPKAQTAVRQGAGRLMRRPGDRGVIALLDPRIRSKSWGKAVLSTLPPAPRTGSLEDVGRCRAR